MAADEAHQPEVHDEDLPFAQRAEALFDTIAAKDGVESEFVEALVTAVAFLGLKVNEPQVTKALHQVAQATENRLSKVEFVRFCENLRVQLPSTGGSHPHDVLDSTGIRDPDDSTLDGGDNGNTPTFVRPACFPEMSSSERIQVERELRRCNIGAAIAHAIAC